MTQFGTVDCGSHHTFISSTYCKEHPEHKQRTQVAVKELTFRHRASSI